MAVPKETLLAAVESSIEAGIESYTVTLPDGGTQTVKMPSLEKLVEFRAQLLRDIDADANQGARRRINFARRGNL